MSEHDPYKPPEVRVDDPTTEGPRLIRARRLARLAGVFLDNLILLVPVYGLMFLGAGLTADSEPPSVLAVFALPALAFFVILGIQLYLLHQRSQTLGKIAVRTKIVRVDGDRAGLGRIFALRMLAPGILSVIPILGPIFGLANALFIFGSEKRCIHDYMADTIVVEA